MPTTQRFHYVLADDITQAKPIIDALVKNGLNPVRVGYLLGRWGLYGLNPKSVAFIFDESFKRRADFPLISRDVSDFILRGAVVKPIPRRVAMEEAANAEPEPLDNWAKLKKAGEILGEARISDYKRIIDAAVQEMAPGAPIFDVKDVEDVAASIQVSEEYLTFPTGSLWDILNSPLYKAGDEIKWTTSTLSPNSAPAENSAPKKTLYQQVFLGGGLMNNVRSPHVFSLVPGDVLYFTDDITTHSYMLYRYPIIGDWVYAWISEDMWGERGTLVREFLLKALI